MPFVQQNKVLHVTGTINDDQVMGLVNEIKGNAKKDITEQFNRMDLNCNVSKEGLELIAQAGLAERLMVRFFPNGNENSTMLYAFDYNASTPKSVLFNQGTEFANSVEAHYNTKSQNTPEGEERQKAFQKPMNATVKQETKDVINDKPSTQASLHNKSSRDGEQGSVPMSTFKK